MISINREDLCWLAGLIEGEGCFRLHAGTPTFHIDMTDLDIVERVRNIMSLDSKIHRVEETEKKVHYRFEIYGTNLVEWMKLLYPLMGIRRKEKISELLDWWDSRNDRDKRKNRNTIKAIAHAKNISIEEARLVLQSIMNGNEVTKQ